MSTEELYISERFDEIIHNGVLVSQSTDVIRITKHIWRGYMSIPALKQPKGVHKYADIMMK